MCTDMILEKFLHETRTTFIFPRVLQAPRQAPFLLILELFGMTGILFFHSSQNIDRTNEKLAAKVFVHDSLFCPLQSFLKTFFFMSICGEFQPHFVEGNSHVTCVVEGDSHVTIGRYFLCTQNIDISVPIHTSDN